MHTYTERCTDDLCIHSIQAIANYIYINRPSAKRPGVQLYYSSWWTAKLSSPPSSLQLHPLPQSRPFFQTLFTLLRVRTLPLALKGERGGRPPPLYHSLGAFLSYYRNFIKPPPRRQPLPIPNNQRFFVWIRDEIAWGDFFLRILLFLGSFYLWGALVFSFYEPNFF